MGIRRNARRPKTGALGLLYDEGVEAARSGGENPYEPHKVSGDMIRSWLWTQGFEDEREMIEIEDLI